VSPQFVVMTRYIPQKTAVTPRMVVTDRIIWRSSVAQIWRLTDRLFEALSPAFGFELQ